MINCNLKGRLGNQMFIYAFAYKLSKENNNEKICFNGRESNRLINYNLKNVILDTEYKNNSLSFVQKLLMKIYAVNDNKMNRKQIYSFEKKFGNFYRKFGLFVCQNGYLKMCRNECKCKKDIYINGFFQSEKYFESVKYDIKEIFTPIKKINNDLVKNQQNSVCVDFRLGDYVNNKLHGVCTVEYYKNAMDYFNNKLDKPIFFIFSTDIDYIKTLIKDWKYNIIIENGKTEDYEKLYLMSSCQNFIITNSTYDWWAQYLCENENKIVVAPKKWFNLDYPCDIYQDNWILMDV